MPRKKIVYLQMCIGCFLFVRFAMHVLETIQFVCIVSGMLLLLHELLAPIREATNFLDQIGTGMIIHSCVAEQAQMLGKA